MALPHFKPVACYPFQPDIVSEAGLELRGILVEGDGASCPLDRFVAEASVGRKVEVRVSSVDQQTLLGADLEPWAWRLGVGYSQLYEVRDPKRGLNPASVLSRSLIRVAVTDGPLPPVQILTHPPFLSPAVELPLCSYIATCTPSHHRAQRTPSSGPNFTMDACAVTIYRRRLGCSLYAFRQPPPDCSPKASEEREGTLMSRASFDNLLACIVGYIDVCAELPHIEDINEGVLYHDLYSRDAFDGGEGENDGGGDQQGWSLQSPLGGARWVVSGGFLPVPPSNIELLRQYDVDIYTSKTMAQFLGMLERSVRSGKLHVYDDVRGSTTTVVASGTTPHVSTAHTSFLQSSQVIEIARGVLTGNLGLIRLAQPSFDNGLDEERRGWVRGMRGLDTVSPTDDTSYARRVEGQAARLNALSPASSSNGSCASLHDMLQSPLCRGATSLLCDCPECRASIAKRSCEHSQKPPTPPLSRPPPLAGAYHHTFVAYMEAGVPRSGASSSSGDEEEEEVVFRPLPQKRPTLPSRDKTYHAFLVQLQATSEEFAAKAAEKEISPISARIVPLPSEPATTAVIPPQALPVPPTAVVHRPASGALGSTKRPPAPPGKKTIKSVMYRKEIDAWAKNAEKEKVREGRCCTVM